MRGKVLDRQIFPIIRRITPAYAGKSKALLLNFIDLKDHPRLCGEKYMIDTKKSPWEGSPPPMRGKVCQVFSVD